MYWLFYYALNVNEKTSFIKRELLLDFLLSSHSLTTIDMGTSISFNNLT